MSEGVLFYAEQDVQQGAADPGVGKLSGFQKIAKELQVAKSFL